MRTAGFKEKFISLTFWVLSSWYFNPADICSPLVKQPETWRGCFLFDLIIISHGCGGTLVRSSSQRCLGLWNFSRFTYEHLWVGVCITEPPSSINCTTSEQVGVCWLLGSSYFTLYWDQSAGERFKSDKLWFLLNSPTVRSMLCRSPSALSLYKQPLW